MATGQQNKFAMAARACKGKPGYRECMSAKLRGGSHMSGGYDMPPIEEYAGTGALSQFVAGTAGYVPSKREVVSLLISGGTAALQPVAWQVCEEVITHSPQIVTLRRRARSACFEMIPRPAM